MLGERGSVFKSIFLNPLVWVSLILTFFTLEYNQDDVFGVFFVPETYRNVAIASAVYVGLFGRKYTDGMRKLDWNETLGGVVEAMLTILFVWFFTLFGIVHYQRGGEAYSELIRQRYRNDGGPTSAMGVPQENTMLDALSKVKVEPGQKYKVTPHDDGSFTVEME